MMKTLPEECTHGLEPAWCTLCLHGPPKRDTRPYRKGPAFEARYESRCIGCGEGIRPGDQICKFTDDSYRHETCR